MAQTTPRDPTIEQGPSTERKQRVLIVDDAEEIRHLLLILFETEGFDVVGEAADGANGLALARRCNPDFIVLDYMMPGMNGAETADLLRAIAPESRIVAFSAVLTEKPEWADAFWTRLGSARSRRCLPSSHRRRADRSPGQLNLRSGS